MTRHAVPVYFNLSEKQHRFDLNTPLHPRHLAGADTRGILGAGTCGRQLMIGQPCLDKHWVEVGANLY